MAERRVPSVYADIKAAVAAAVSGADEVILEQAGSPFQGVNNRNVDLGGKAITIRGETGDPTDIVVDCENLGSNGFICTSGELLTTIIKDLTVYRAYDTAGWSGGILIHSGSSPTIQNVIVDLCQAQYDPYGSGGGINILHAGSDPLIENCILKHNRARYKAAGVRVESGNPNPLFNNCLVYNNGDSPPLLHGGGFYFSTADGTLRNCTIYNNSAGGGGSAYGGGVFCDGTSTVTLYDCIIWDNNAGAGGDELAEVAGTMTLNNCCYQNLAGDVYGTPIFNNCITSNPLLVNPGAADYHLEHIAAGQGSDSPCIDAGSDTAVNLGMDDKTTRTDSIADTGQVDMGWHYLGGIPPALTGKLNMMQLVP